MRVSGSDPTRVFQSVVCSNESCGAENPVTYRFCMKCGTPLASARPAIPDPPAAHDSGEAEKPSSGADSTGIRST